MGQFNIDSLLKRIKKSPTRDSKDLTAPWSLAPAIKNINPPSPLKEHTILFVCTGNIARSASAELLARHMAPNSGWNFASAGIGAMVNYPVAEHLDQLLQKDGVEYQEHRAQQLSEPLVSEAELILVMDRSHLEWIIREWPEHRSKVHLLKHVARLRTEAGKRSDLISYMKNVSSPPLKSDDLSDPYRRGPQAAQTAYQQIKDALEIIIPWLGTK